MNRVIQAHTPLDPAMLTFRSMSGQEGLSQLFEFEVELLCPTHSLDMKSLLGKPLSLEIETGAGAPRFLSGHVVRCAMVGRDSGVARAYVYRATVRPWLWYLTQTSDNKIFQNRSVPEVLDEVLGEYGFPVEKALTHSYRKWEYCVQYEETDFAFVSRLMEHEGIYYWFRHERDGHVLVLTDDAAQHEAFPGYESLPYYGQDRAASPREEYVGRWEVAEQITPGGFATVDYDFKKPAASLDAMRRNPGAYDHSDLEIFEWQGGYTDPEHAEHYARVRLEALQQRHEQVSAHSNARGVAPGCVFTLRNHPRQSENREYLVVAAHYMMREAGYATGHEVAAYETSFVVQPAQMQFRAPRTTPVPRTHGPQTATVVGPQGEEIWTDEYGRVKVHFHWDRHGQRNQNSSCWVRVSSPWAGGGFGGIQLPRVKDEVIIDFICGQPDRPIVIGRVYNASNMPPWELPASATQSGFISRSRNGTPENANALRFEDRPGAEEVWLHAERDLKTDVENNELHSVDGLRLTTIQGDDTTLVMAGNRLVDVQSGTDTLHVKGTRTVTVDGRTTEHLNDGLRTYILATGEEREVTGSFKETIKTGDQSIYVDQGDALRHVKAGTLTERAKQQVEIESENAGMTLKAKQKVEVRSEANAMDLSAQEKVLLESRANAMDIKAKNDILIETSSGKIDINAAQSINLTAPQKIYLNGKEVRSFSKVGFWNYTPYALNLTLAHSHSGIVNNGNWAFNATTSAAKVDATLYKMDLFRVAQKVGSIEFKNKTLETSTGGMRIAMWALCHWY